MIALTSDLGVLRIGSQLYTKDENYLYQLNSNVDTHNLFIDEFASRHRHIATTTRRDFPKSEVERRDTQLTEESLDMQNLDVLLQVAGGHVSSQASTNPTTVQGTDETGTVDTSKSSNTSVDVESDSELIDDIRIEDAKKFTHVSRREAITAEDLDADENLFKSDSDASGNTAEEDWSDGSSDMLSDEVEDEDQWNDWGNERLTIEELNAEERDFEARSSDESEASAVMPDFDDLESFTSEISDSNLDEIWTAGGGDEIKISGFTFNKGDLGIDSDSASSSDASSIRSNYTQSNYSDDASDNNSELDVETAKHLDALIFGKGSREGKQRISIQVHDLTGQNGKPVFHFARYVTRSIFDSPPCFHPSKPLLVWPLGDAEILFADYKANTFFTRRLCCSRFKSCHVFIKAHFSSSGEYLHFAALEATPKEAKDDSEKGSLLLSLQVSTHRLSIRKTTRSPSRLVYRSTIDLGAVPTLNVSSSPYTLHWTDQEVYLTTRGQTLNVTRIPLFPNPASSKSGSSSSVCYIQKDVYLPRTIESRTLHFFPKPAPTSRAPTTRSKTSGLKTASQKKNTMAKIIIGSHSAIPSQALLVPRYQVCPPTGVLLDDEKHLGGWKCKTVSCEAGEARQRLNNAGGRLQGKFESFDRNEDCDIVPFLY